jgi:phage-related holin
MNKDWGNFNSLLTVLAVLYTCVFLSVLIDLFFGVRRAKRLKIVRTSFGYRRTITKLTSYFGLMLMLSIADIVASVVFKMPYFTVAGAVGIVLVEAKSVFENLKQQEKSIAEVQSVLLKILENKDEIQNILALLNADKKEDKQ